MRVLLLMLLGLGVATGLGAAEVAPVVKSLMDEEEGLRGVPFPEVVQAATGRRVVPLVMTNQTDRELVRRIGQALDAAMRQLNAPDSPARQQRRINEVSALFEAELRSQLNAGAGLRCDYPQTAEGRRQRSGYPDLRVTDERSGRVIYLDPKLYERGGRSSTLRTFYYEPKRATNKILDDGHHLLVGFEHDGQVGAWTFTGWTLVDLSGLRVCLKAEFQGSNKDLYQPESIVGSSEAKAPGR